MTLNEFAQQAAMLSDLPADGKVQRMPALFVGHGSPMNGIEDNVYVQGWKTLGETLPRPTAILSISAHWLTEGTFVHTAKTPRTIHDFWGFPKELYDISYPCPGSPEYAESTRKLLLPRDIGSDTAWGIDHGTWIVLHRMFPQHDIPVFQMSIDLSRPASFHYELGKDLGALRKKGVLIMGSGNIVHNLGRIDFSENAKVFDWAEEFDREAEALIAKGDHASLIDHEKLGAAAQLAIPSPDHYWPLLYILGLQESGEEVSFPITGIAHSSISMRAVKIG